MRNMKNMKNMKIVGWVAYILVIIGALNWGLVGFFHFDLVATLFGDMSMLSRVVYGLIGLAGLYSIYHCSKGCKKSEET